jgi:hypothetical protein
MPRGGKREGAGRKPGQIPKAKRELMDMAKEHADGALLVLVDRMNDVAESGSNRISAATAILDRAYGRPRQMIEGPGPDGEHLHKVSADEAFSRLAGRLGGFAPGTASGPDSAE